MAKSAKKAAKKLAKKPAKKAAKKPVKKAAKIPARKPVKKSGKKFLIIYHAPLDAMARTASPTPEQQAAGMALWMAWAEKCGSKIVDLGLPLVNGKKIATSGSQSPSTKEIVGYSVLQAENWDELLYLLEGHPHISGWHPEASIEVHETMVLPGM
jgi:hypothetical protein